MSNNDIQRPTTAISGIHHVTAISGPAARNVQFYTDVLGQRLVKKTVNFDDPGTWHLYYGDGTGTPGSIMTFFPWALARRGRPGAGQAMVTSYVVPEGSLNAWKARLAEHGVSALHEGELFGEKTLDFEDPDGLLLRLVEVAGAEELPAWEGAPAEIAARGFRSVTLGSAPGSGTWAFLEEVMGFEKLGEDGVTTRYRVAPAEADDPFGGVLDVVETAEAGIGGAGTVHHIAFRIADDPSELEWQSFLGRSGCGVSPVMDRQYFHSIYFREPGGVLFEIATDPPGFAIDEPVEALGEALRLPPQYESRRARIEAALPSLKTSDSKEPAHVG